MVVGVVEKLRIPHALNSCLATWTGIPAAICELEAAVATNELVFLFRGHHTIALPTTNEAGEGKSELSLRSGSPVATKKLLHTIILSLRDEGLMFTLIPLVAATWIFKPAIVEGPGKNVVDTTTPQLLAAHLPCCSCAESPLPVCNLENPRGAVEPREHHIPHATNERESFRVFDQSILTGLLVGVVEIPNRRHAWKPTILYLGFESALHILAQIVNVFLSHAELDIHEDYIVIFTPEVLSLGYDPDTMLLDGPND